MDIDSLLKEAAQLEAALAEVKMRIAALADRAGAATPRASDAEITEETLLAISAAVAAYLGKRPRIRQVRLATSPAWVSVGRASIAASHLPLRTP